MVGPAPTRRVNSETPSIETIRSVAAPVTARPFFPLLPPLLLEQHRQGVRNRADGGFLGRVEPVRDIAVDVDLSQDLVVAPDQHDEFRSGLDAAGEIAVCLEAATTAVSAAHRSSRPGVANAAVMAS